MSRRAREFTPAARDAALRRMRTLNRLLIGVAVAGTGLLADVAAQAFPGHRRSVPAAAPARQPKAPDATAARTARDRAGAARHHHHAHHRLRAPAQSPASAPPQTAAAQAAPPQTAPAQPAPAQTAPAQPAPAQTAPAQPAPPQPAPAPVVSGGS